MSSKDVPNGDEMRQAHSIVKWLTRMLLMTFLLNVVQIVQYQILRNDREKIAVMYNEDTDRLIVVLKQWQALYELASEPVNDLKMYQRKLEQLHVVPDARWRRIIFLEKRMIQSFDEPITDAKEQEFKEVLCKEYNLPLQSSFAEIAGKYFDQWRKKEVKKLSLPTKTSWDTIKDTWEKKGWHK